MAQIRVSEKLYTKLTLLKPESDSFNVFIGKMYTYFEVTGVDINSKIISPVIAIQEAEKKLSKNDERIIKILMKFRNDYFVRLQEHLDKGSFLSSESKAEGITEEEAKEMIEVNEALSKKISDLEKQLEKEKLNTTPGPAAEGYDNIIEKCNVIKTRLHDINSQVLPNNLNPENIQIKKAKFQLFYRSTLSDLNDIINT